ncbi:histidine phosphotransferase family protein [Rhodovarius lipocyclicus]|uniref:histidine phosphotransferase family protein n=1 Tax=Rhodovarius lipocyclicus TaxID=268410 RepID=UPI001356D526|nr:histidine phosphotransferase family protein [Rhodovarius lipocyclicus]
MSEPEVESPLQLASLVAARLTHDLAGPLGTIMAASGAGGGLRSDELLQETVTELRLRMRLYGAAFGRPDALSWQEMAELLQGAPGSHRLQFRFQVPDPAAPQPEGLSQLLLAAAMLAAEALPRGGQVTVMAAPGEPVIILPEGRTAMWPHGFVTLLAGERAAEAETPRGLLAGWVAALARAQKCRLSIGFGGGPVAAPLMLTPARG